MVPMTLWHTSRYIDTTRPANGNKLVMYLLSQVLGNGYSKIPLVDATFTYPAVTEDNETLLYLYDVTCESQNSESGVSAGVFVKD